MPEQTYNYTGGGVSFVVPTWVTQIAVEVAGAQGGSSVFATGGLGGLVYATVPVTPGETLTINVGSRAGHNGGGAGGVANGASSFDLGGSGGGYSALIRTGGIHLVIAGGGGGAGGTAATVASGSDGGLGGGTTATAGQQGQTQGGGGTGGGGGGGGTQAAGGTAGSAGGSAGANVGNAGGVLVGGAGGPGLSGNNSETGGGGGGGYRGGGGGGSACGTVIGGGGGGGGGSSYTDGSVLSVQHSQGSRAGDGYVKISYGGVQASAPTNILPAAGSTIATTTPTLSATLVAEGTNRQRAEWQLATSSDFIQNLRTVTEPTTDLKVSGVATEVVPIASKLTLGAWYLRARTLDEGNVGSPWSGTQQFTVAYTTSASPVSPFSGQAIAYNAVGITMSWLFSSPTTEDAQTAYQVVVTDAATGASVADTGKVISTAKIANVVIPASKKNSVLSWRVRVWGQDNIAGPYSTAVTFIVADAPGITVATMTTVATSAPVINFTFTPVVAPLALYRVMITKVSDGSLAYDSGWVGPS